MAMAVAAGLATSFPSQLPALPLLLLSPRPPLPFSISLTSCTRFTGPFPRPSAVKAFRQSFELSAQDSSPPALPSDQAENGPVEIPPDVDPLALPGNSPLRTVGGVVLTGLIAFFLFRSLKKRAQRSKEMRFRSSGVERVKVEEEKQDATSAISIPDVKRPPPSALQTILGAIFSGGIAIILYNFATHVEEGFSRQQMPSTYTIRQLTITIRTIINGLCYLATFIFAANSIGLTLYSFQLLFNLGQDQSPGGKEDEETNNSKLMEAVSEEITEKE